MSKQMKNCPGAATPRQQVEKESFGEGTVSKNYFTTYSEGIARFLSYGSENAIPRKHLRMISELDDRTLRVEIQRERLQGIPILSDNLGGYYLPANDCEMERFVKSMKGRSKEILRVAEAIEKVRLNNRGENH